MTNTWGGNSQIINTGDGQIQYVQAVATNPTFTATDFALQVPRFVEAPPPVPTDPIEWVKWRTEQVIAKVF